MSLSEGVDIEKRRIIIYHTVNGNKFTFVVSHTAFKLLHDELSIIIVFRHLALNVEMIGSKRLMRWPMYVPELEW